MWSHRWYRAVNAIDGDFNSVSSTGYQRQPWLSVRLPPGGLRIGAVAVYNRRSGPKRLLGNIEVWVGTQMGDRNHFCGSATYDAAKEPQPYVVSCGGYADGRYVTIIQPRTSGGGYLAIAEVVVYEHVDTPTADVAIEGEQVCRMLTCTHSTHTRSAHAQAR